MAIKHSKIVVNVMVILAFVLLLPGCASVNRMGVLSPERGEAFTFVVMGDNRPLAHAQDKFTQPPYFRRAIGEINLLDPDFVVITGDLILGYTRDEARLTRMWDGFDAAAAEFKVPYYQVIGNHDVSNAMMQRVYLERYGDRFPLFYSFDYKGYHFIALDSDLDGEYSNITGRQLAWLKKDLELRRRDRKTFVFLHKPLWKNENSNWMKEVHPLMARYGVDTVFAAHRHKYTKFATLDGVRYLVTGGAGAELRGPDFTGSFHHYCVVTVRDGRVSIAVVRTGYIENEEIVNEELLEKVDAMTAGLYPLGLRLKRGAVKIEELDIVISNPFNEKLEGTLAWEVPEGSPWRMPAAGMAISVGPGEEQRLTVQAPPGGSLSNMKPLEPFPVGIWNLSVGGRTLWKSKKAKVIIDQWPYAGARRALKKAFSMDSAGKIAAGPEVSTILRLHRENPTEWGLRETVAWRLPGGCRWKVSPASAVIDLAPGEEREVGFNVSFTGSPEEIFPLPRLDSVVKLDGEEVLKTSARLPIDAREYFLKKVRVARGLRVESAPELDGKLDDPVWRQSPVVSNFLLPEAGGGTDYPTEVRFAYDSENLYVSFRCFEPNLPGLVTKVKKRDKATYFDDSVEIFLDTNFDRKTYYQYAFNANGVVYDSRGRNKRWNGSCTVKVGREPDAWTLEVAIPWKTMGMEPPTAGTKIGLELVRTRAQEPREMTQWSPTFGGNHTPSRFGVLVLE